MKKIINDFKINIMSRSVNEGFLRTVTAAFCSLCDPTIEEISDIKTAVSEAVTNSIVHGYREKEGKIYITVNLYDNNNVRVKIRDKGIGIENIEKAMEPLFTTSKGERAGLGFAVMESMMDRIRVISKVGKGTTVTLDKKIRGKIG